MLFRSYLDPVTNSSTIYANFIGTSTIQFGNFLISGNTITNVINGPINLTTNGDTWTFNTDGSLTAPNYTFPIGHGTAGQFLTDDGSGNLYWSTYSYTLPDGSVTTSKLADYAVTDIKISTATITADKLNTTGVASSSTYLNGLFQWVPVTSGSASTSTLVNGTATFALLSTGSVQFSNGTVQSTAWTGSVSTSSVVEIGRAHV